MVLLGEAVGRVCGALVGRPGGMGLWGGGVLAEGVWVEVGGGAGIDGWAVRAGETEGASEYAPLAVRGIAVMAGAALPEGADAVLPLHGFEGGMALMAVAPGDGVVPLERVELAAGTELGPRQIGLLAQAGVGAVKLRARPLVALQVAGAKVGADALTPMLSDWLGRLGVEVGEEPDLILRAGRSGPGADDDGAAAFDRVEFHGVALQPGETAGFGWIGERPALLLPGEPFACAVVFALLVAPALRHLSGRGEPAAVRVRLGRKIASPLGLAEAVAVRVEDGVATPLAGGLAQAAGSDGLVVVPPGLEGYPAGAVVDLSLWP